jgi:integration host factor subunit beta
MTRSQLVAALAAHFPNLTQADAAVSVKLIILAAIGDTLAEGARVEIRGSGSFDTRHRTGRTGRNPATSQIVQVRAKSVPHFKPGRELHERVGDEGAQARCARTSLE